MILMQLIGDDLIDRADSLTAFWDTACKGSSALSAALCRASLDELALLENKTPITAYWDIQKFYDNVNISKLIKAAFEMDLPLRAMGIALQMHLAPRILSVNKWASRIIQVSNSLIAGC